MTPLVRSIGAHVVIVSFDDETGLIMLLFKSVKCLDPLLVLVFSLMFEAEAVLLFKMFELLARTRLPFAMGKFIPADVEAT